MKANTINPLQHEPLTAEYVNWYKRFPYNIESDFETLEGAGRTEGNNIKTSLSAGNLFEPIKSHLIRIKKRNLI